MPRRDSLHRRGADPGEERRGIKTGKIEPGQNFGRIPAEFGDTGDAAVFAVLRQFKHDIRSDSGRVPDHGDIGTWCVPDPAQLVVPQRQIRFDDADPPQISERPCQIRR